MPAGDSSAAAATCLRAVSMMAQARDGIRQDHGRNRPFPQPRPGREKSLGSGSSLCDHRLISQVPSGQRAAGSRRLRSVSMMVASARKRLHLPASWNGWAGLSGSPAQKPGQTVAVGFENWMDPSVDSLGGRWVVSARSTSPLRQAASVPHLKILEHETAANPPNPKEHEVESGRSF